MIHIFEQNGYTLVLDVYSGSVHVVDPEAAELIRLCEHLSPADAEAQYMQEHPQADAAEIREAIAQIESLRQSGQLYSDDSALCKAADAPGKPKELKALCLNVAHACNLCCSYCFAGQGNYQGASALMPYETGKQALDYLVAQSGRRRNLEVDFFGGEPLLNWDVVKRLVQYGRSIEQQHDKNFRFTLTTNGVLLDDEVIDFCNREMHNVVLSLDGRPQVHDRFRVDRQGRGSYAQVVPKFQQLVKARGDQGYYIRGTFTRHNLDFVQDVLHMADLGFTQLSMEPMVGGEGDPAALREEDLPQLFEQYEQLATIMLDRKRAGKGFEFYHYMLDLKGGPCLYKRLSGCGSGTEYLAVTPSGKLYPCHQFIGETGYLLGDVWQGITNPDAQRTFDHCGVTDRKECADCWAKLYCAGGCAANSYHASGSVQGIYPLGCEVFKKRMESALMLHSALEIDEEVQ